ncbi:MAG: sulfite exporter TauE/SafE family protein [Ruminococcaceae bacterium]|nr:sulfite exporter TauE/SafE family protein [Oscillospiraceae bacterium]
MKNKISYLFGLLCGFLNGLFGSGGGTVAVPCLEKNGLETKKAHASSVLLIFVLSLFTAVIYFINGKLDFSLSMQFIPYGIAGAVVGSITLKKISSDLLKKIFGIIIIVSGVRILL